MITCKLRFRRNSFAAYLILILSCGEIRCGDILDVEKLYMWRNFGSREILEWKFFECGEILHRSGEVLDVENR